MPPDVRYPQGRQSYTPQYGSALQSQLPPPPVFQMTTSTSTGDAHGLFTFLYILPPAIRTTDALQSQPSSPCTYTPNLLGAQRSALSGETSSPPGRPEAVPLLLGGIHVGLQSFITRLCCKSLHAATRKNGNHLGEATAIGMISPGYQKPSDFFVHACRRHSHHFHRDLSEEDEILNMGPRCAT